MSQDTIVDRIDMFLLHGRDYFSWANAARINATIAIDQLSHNIDDPKVRQAVVDAEDRRLDARAKLLKRGPSLAEEMEIAGQDSSDLLRFLYCVDGGGGPDAAAPLWPDLKVVLQRLAIRLGRPHLNETDQKCADYIRANPGCGGKQVADEVRITFEHFRRLYLKKLKPHGFTNHGDGYYPPAAV